MREGGREGGRRGRQDEREEGRGREEAVAIYIYMSKKEERIQVSNQRAPSCHNSACRQVPRARTPQICVRLFTAQPERSWQNFLFIIISGKGRKKKREKKTSRPTQNAPGGFTTTTPKEDIHTFW